MSTDQNNAGEWTEIRIVGNFNQQPIELTAFVPNNLGHQARPVEPAQEFKIVHTSDRAGLLKIAEDIKNAKECIHGRSLNVRCEDCLQASEPAPRECHHHRVTKECHECAAQSQEAREDEEFQRLTKSPIVALPQEAESPDEFERAVKRLHLLGDPSFWKLADAILAREKAHKEQVANFRGEQSVIRVQDDLFVYGSFEATSAVQHLALQVEQLHEQLLEAQKLSSEWMRKHDALSSGKTNIWIEKIEQLQRELADAEAARDTYAELVTKLEESRDAARQALRELIGVVRFWIERPPDEIDWLTRNLREREACDKAEKEGGLKE